MSLDQQAISHAIAALYDSVADPSCWPAALGILCEVLDGAAATLAMFDAAGQSAHFASASGDPRITLPLLSTQAEHMSFYGVLRQLTVDVPIALSDVFALHGPRGRDVWFESPLYSEWAEPLGIASSINVVVFKQPGRLGILNIATHQSRRNIDHNDLAMMSVVAPHVRRAVTVGDLFDFADRRAEMFEALLEALSYAVIVVGTDMQVLYANPAAKTLLDDQSAVRFGNGRLNFTYAAAASSVANAVATGHRDEFLLGPAGINVPLNSADRPAVAHVLPLARRPDPARFASGAAAAVFIAAAGTTPLPAIDAVAALFDLTPAEKHVAAMVAEGRTRAEIAAAHGVADGTVKSQLGIIFQKTCTGDQRELQRLVRELTPPIRAS
ncbi:MAG: helix-turn-helix transcriptional regulator [Devosia sp.]